MLAQGRGAKDYFSDVEPDKELFLFYSVMIELE